MFFFVNRRNYNNKTFAKSRLGILWKEKIGLFIFSFQTVNSCEAGSYLIIKENQKPDFLK